MSALTKAAVTAALAAWVGGAKVALAALVALATYGIGGPRRLLYLLRHTLGRDIRAAGMMVRLVLLVKRAEWSNLSVSRMFDKSVRRHPDKVMLRFEEERWTFRMVDEYSDKVANVFAEKGFKKGDVVAVFMENRPEFVATWYVNQCAFFRFSTLGTIFPNKHFEGWA